MPLITFDSSALGQEGTLFF